MDQEKAREEYERLRAEHEAKRKLEEERVKEEMEKAKLEYEKKNEEKIREKKVFFHKVNRLVEFVKRKIFYFANLDDMKKTISQYQSFDAVALFREIDGLSKDTKGFITSADLAQYFHGN